MSDPEGRPTVMSLIRGVGSRVYPVGRLDYASEGLLLMTNDGILFWHDYGGKGSLRPLAKYLEGLAKRCPLYRVPGTTLAWAPARELKAALKAAGKTAEFKVYPGAPHGFHADYRPSYRKEAAEDAWKQATAWFKKYDVLG